MKPLDSLMSKVYNIIFFNKNWKTVFYNSLILLTLYKTNQQKLKIYNTFTIKFYGSGDADYIRRCALASQTSHIMLFCIYPFFESKASRKETPQSRRTAVSSHSIIETPKTDGNI